jgi:phosphoribosylanthranilate isomerase
VIRVKICGITTVHDAIGCVEAGVDALGLNFWAGSLRRCADDAARAIVDAVGDRVRLVAVLVDADDAHIARVTEELGIRWLQLHGSEPPARVAALGPWCFKAVHVASDADLTAARAMPGAELLVDARAPGSPGGTGLTCDWTLAATLAAERDVWLAGGLRASNVAEAVAIVRPAGVDVASGVERRPGVKDLAEVAAFVAAVRKSRADFVS